MINGRHYYFFRLDSSPGDPHSEYRIAESIEDLLLRFGAAYLQKFYAVTKLNEVTIEHIIAIDRFLI